MCMPSVSEIQDWLAEVYGFPIPKLFAQTTQLVLAFMEEGYEDTFEYLGWALSPAYSFFKGMQTGHKVADRYSCTPIEMFSFGWSGTDGEHYGYLVHAPELNQTDFPIVEFEPMNDFGVNLIGEDTRSGLENLLSLMAISGYAAALDQHEALASALDLYPSAQKADWYNNHRAVVPQIPEGYRYQTSSDGVGVLAPSEAFSPDHSVVLADIDDIYDLEIGHQQLLKKAQTALNKGYPATALAIIRERYWQEGFEDNQFDHYAPLWQQVYEALDRPLLSSAVENALQQKLVIQNDEEPVLYVEGVDIVFWNPERPQSS